MGVVKEAVLSGLAEFRTALVVAPPRQSILPAKKVLHEAPHTFGEPQHGTQKFSTVIAIDFNLFFPALADSQLCRAGR